VSAELIPELQRLGQRLAQARQARGLSLDEQADRLHMGSEQLRALEEGNRAELPEAVFVVAQARRVAASLGLNIDTEITALRGSQAFQAHSLQRPGVQQPPDPAVPAAPTAGPAPSPGRPPPRPGRPLLLAGFAVATAAALGWGIQHRLTNGLPWPQPQAGDDRPQAPPADTGPSEPHLVLRSAAPSWLEVRSADGELLYRGTLEGEQRFALTGELQVLAGRPDLVSATSGSGPARPLGPIEAVTWYRFRPEPAPAPAP
jgi:cytoskeleton protein RodZ